jgi:NhaA family Na+:H+ antiporter
MSSNNAFTEFFNSEKAGGIMLLIATVLSLILANSVIGPSYTELWSMYVGPLTLGYWINDGLMAIFFLLIGLELQREIYQGELSTLKSAALPLFGALGGVLLPAGIYMWLNAGTPTSSGAGIPMATDIAFAIGVLSLLGSRVPLSLKIFLTALAVIDDLVAILVIAIFYTSNLDIVSLGLSLGIFVLLLTLNKVFKVRLLWVYLIGGAAMWAFMLSSGVHATIAGVLLAFTIPFTKGDHHSPAAKMEHTLHKPVAFFILPLFAMANTGIVISSEWAQGLGEASSMGIMLGLIFGKPIGIFFFSLVGSILGLCALPKDLKWTNILGVGFLGGIGFTMSIFITLLAFKGDPLLIDNSKIAILLASLTAGTIGYLFLSATLKKPQS